MRIILTLDKIADYRLFLRVKSLPSYRFVGRTAVIPQEYVNRIGITDASLPSITSYRTAVPAMWDYQKAIVRLAIQKQKFCIFADCGLGKTLMFLEFARHAGKVLPPDRCVLIVSPLMVIKQTLAECKRFYGDRLPITQLRADTLGGWIGQPAGRIGIVNYEAIRPELHRGQLGALILDESSMLKSHYGKWGTKLLELGRGLEWKMACTGTPAPNDRIEFANHAVFMDAFPNVNSFLARYFVNRGQTQERWALKPYALKPFYRSLSHWCIFLTNPATYGWQDNTRELPPIEIHVSEVDLTSAQQELVYTVTGRLILDEIGGITSRSVLSQIAKGHHRGKRIPTNKPEYIRNLVEQWPDESTIIWCMYNAEQKTMEEAFPDAASIAGDTPLADRQQMIDDFKVGRRRILISKPRILGFGLNLEIATRQVFSGLQDSYEAFYQAVKRSNRYGAKLPLHVHIPVTDIERPMIDTVLQKAARIQRDTEEQERLFAGDYSGNGHKLGACHVAG